MFPSKSDHKTKRKLNKYNELNLDGKIKVSKHLESYFTQREAVDQFKISKGLEIILIIFSKTKSLTDN